MDILIIRTPIARPMDDHSEAWEYYGRGHGIYWDRYTSPYTKEKVRKSEMIYAGRDILPYGGRAFE